MLLEFSVKNFRSINELQTISFAATGIRSSEENRIVDDNNIVRENGRNILKTVGIYGANTHPNSNMSNKILHTMTKTLAPRCIY
jgi:uncharacterized protein